MAHQPERPQEYVCEGCHTIVAGTARGDPPDHDYAQPDECAACGGTEFVELQNYPSME
ncbi:hypothetical protein [Haloarcula nitratireducens]|uniref:Small CPxCG-related zinc finger protein n=1 Tax=Haloarcula nitratireducens TaxID=2487749 RepID=A0AAW4PA69_9EURY|nr:hypothetical protein [Halomicroarcula nitratireducens]MBX0294996.1 hypothetical protein [Halomicroarcula nitratireducens]